jgi:hypothetical protein
VWSSPIPGRSNASTKWPAVFRLFISGNQIHAPENSPDLDDSKLAGSGRRVGTACDTAPTDPETELRSYSQHDLSDLLV